jgi:uncharacterized protein (TIRG00374 family)
MDIKRFLPVIGIIILIVLLYQFDFTGFVEVIDQLPLPFFILSLGSSIPVVLISNVEWQYLLKKQHINVSFFYSMKNIFIGYFYGFITPGGLGGYTRALYLKDESNEPLEKCLYNIGLINTIDIITLFFISIIGAFLFSRIYPVLFLIFVVLCVIWILFLVILIHQKTWTWILHFLFRFTIFKPYHQWISTSIENLKNSLPSKKHIVITMFLSLIGWMIRFTLFFFVLMLFSVEVSYFYVIFIIAIANIIGLIPISIYGLGARETILISFFSLFSISPTLIIGVSLVWYVIIWVIPSVLGSGITLFEKKTRTIL